MLARLMSTAQIQQQFELGQAMHRQGRLGLAESHYLRVVKLDPAHAEAWHLLGVCAFQAGQGPRAIKHYRRALQARPRFAQAWNNLGLALKAAGQGEAALDAFRQALDIRPEYAEAAFNLGLALGDRGDFDDAERVYRQVLAWTPDSIAALTNLGNLLRRADRARDALAPLQRAATLSGSAEAACNLALAHIDLGEFAQARDCATHATALDADDALTWATLGSACRLQGDLDAALPALERAVAIDDGQLDAWHELALVREAGGDHAGAGEAFARALALAPDDERVRWAAALSLPALPRDEAEVDLALEAFARGIESLRQRPARDPRAELAAAASVTPFAMHYLARDTRALQNAFGDLVTQVVARARPKHRVPETRVAPERARIGFVGAHFTRHTVSRYFNAFIESLDRERFEVFVWHTGEQTDAISEHLQGRVEHFAHHTGDLDALAARIADAALDALIFPEIGMDARQLALAAMRLAPRQGLLYGHPASCGLATMDVFFSGEALEPVDGAAHYRERLWRLPGVGAAPSAPSVAPDPTWFANWRDQRPVLVCAQPPNKIVPAFDDVIAEVLARSGARLLIFDRHAALTRRYLDRLASPLRARGLDVADVVSAQPMLSYPEFLGALDGATVVLDTPWFSGGATSLDALAMGAVVIAWESTFARGRQTSAMLRLIGADDGIAHDAASYVERALMFTSDATERQAMHDRIRRRAPLLFANEATCQAFADALWQWTR